jgi:glycosyltransferase involved in cell wall biosynthesis
MKLSVIVPCYNAANTIAIQLEALASQQWSEPWEVIIADNGSTDNTIAIAELYKNRISALQIVDASAKQGPAYARNYGASFASSDALAFCDADDEVAPGWVAAMGTALAKYDFVTGQSLYNKLNEASVVLKYGSEQGVSIIDNPYLPFAISCNIGVKRSVHKAIGGFDENFTMIEDIDYSWCIQEKGIKLYQVPEAIVHYRLRKNLQKVCQRAWKVGVYEALLYKKHQSYGIPKVLMSWKSFIKTPIVFILEVISLKIRNNDAMSEWLKTLAWRAGQFVGCLKFGYLPI